MTIISKGKARKDTKGSTRKIAVGAQLGVKQLRRLVHPEKFEYEKNGVDQLPTFTAVVTPLLDLQQGDNNGQRTGLQVYAKALRLSYDWIVNNTNAEPQKTRVMVICDTSQTGTVPSSADLFGAFSGAENIVNAPIAAINLPRFKVLYDHKGYVANNGNQAQVNKKFIRINKRVSYIGTAAADTGKNMLYLVFCSSNSALNQPSFNYVTRINYLDN